MTNSLHTHMDGAGVFSFAIKRAPQSVNLLLDEFGIAKEQIGYFLFHQANRMINNKIQKKLGIPDEKCPYNLELYGNTSSTSIPLMISCEFPGKILSGELCLACGFGVGLQWGSVVFRMPQNLISINREDYK